jgi:hypothetical protein
MQRHRLKRFGLITAAAMLLVGAAASVRAILTPAGPEQEISFNRDIRPILNQHCTGCHGGVTQAGGVSFVFREEALGTGKSGRQIIVPGRPGASELMARITSSDPALRMPFKGAPLDARQIELLRRWIKQGARWEEHWAFVPPKPQPLPRVRDVRWPRSRLDSFVLARLEREGLKPAPEAGRAELLRRVSFDLTGLPPSDQELAAFLSDERPDAYERQVDRLLASPGYGERWAAPWLDLARYADSRGLMVNPDRSAWPYRDWVIAALNANLPYDRFVVTQLAGDLLPNPTLDDMIATAFQRQTATNDEGGSDDEEFRTLATMDRVSTTWSVLNGVTMSCVQCHSHPYDPIRHDEYYKFLAFYNTTRDADLPDDYPTLPVPAFSQRPQVTDLVRRRSALEAGIVGSAKQAVQTATWLPLPIQSGNADEADGLRRYVSRLRAIDPRVRSMSVFKEVVTESEGRMRRALARKKLIPLTVKNGEAIAGSDVAAQSTYRIKTSAANVPATAVRIEVPPVSGRKALSSPEDGFMIDEVSLQVLRPGGTQAPVPLQRVFYDSAEDLRAAARSGDGARTAFAADSKMITTRWLVLIPERPIPAGSRLNVTIVHTQAIAREADLFGAPPKSGPGQDGLMAQAHSQNLMDKGAALTSSAAGKPTYARKLRIAISGDPGIAAKGATIDRLFASLVGVQQRLDAIPAVPLPIMSEQPATARRQTLVFDRGNMTTKVGQPLTPDVPRLFPNLPANAPRDRLTMARWFFRPDQPLTARVAVNRMWEQLFGTGIVETLEDFGSVGQEPSHPELLDWLALRFQNDLGWNQKAMLREIVTSATYRQAAAAPQALVRRDPRNRLLARGPQQRLTAEMLRDQALMASGLLNPAMGGPPVMPPQPAGADPRWKDATGPDRYRRAIYTLRRRGAIYPSFLTFDASAHEISLARRIPTNTPLQALVTLNDPAFVEASAALARRLQSEVPEGPDALGRRLDIASRRILSRELTPAERRRLERLHGQLCERSAPRGSKAKGPHGRGGMCMEGDRLATVVSVMFNLDAAMTR